MLTLLLLLLGQETIEPRRVFLGTPGDPEWEEFAGETPAGRRLDLKFMSMPKATTLFLRQEDVKLGWAVELNGRRLGALHLMEHPLTLALPVSADALKDGENILSIVPPKAADDIRVGEIRLDARPWGTLDVTVTEEGRPVPCRVTVTDVDGALAPLSGGPGVRPGVFYIDGHARVSVPRGTYIVTASRGFEYGIDRVTVEVVDVRQVSLAIRREVPTPGLVACDTHIHTLEFSGHGDASVEERRLTLAGEGVELPIVTEHNQHRTYEGGPRFTPIGGNEVTTKKGHFNVFPATGPVPDWKEERWPELMRSMRASGAQVVILNHPRDLHSNFRPFDHLEPITGELKMGGGFDAVEVINSGALQSDPMQLFRDWFALLNHGYRVAGVAGSDSHDVARYTVGQGRTYVAVDDRDPGNLDVAAAVESFRAGRVQACLGLLTKLERVGEEVEVTVLGPSWVRADRVELYVNGVRLRELSFTSGPDVEKFRRRWRIPRLKHDAWMVAVASGPGVREAFGAIPKPYKPRSKAWEPRVLGSSPVLWLGTKSPRKTARGILATLGKDPEKLRRMYEDIDEAVAAQLS
ncbi:MAG TPA: CehA/McbA family metallohydrolase, partial [Planctomycetota bacterium]